MLDCVIYIIACLEVITELTINWLAHCCRQTVSEFSTPEIKSKFQFSALLVLIPQFLGIFHRPNLVLWCSSYWNLRHQARPGRNTAL